MKTITITVEDVDANAFERLRDKLRELPVESVQQIRTLALLTALQGTSTDDPIASMGGLLTQMVAKSIINEKKVEVAPDSFAG